MKNSYICQKYSKQLLIVIFIGLIQNNFSMYASATLFRRPLLGLGQKSKLCSSPVSFVRYCSKNFEKNKLNSKNESSEDPSYEKICEERCSRRLNALGGLVIACWTFLISRDIYLRMCARIHANTEKIKAESALLNAQAKAIDFKNARIRVLNRKSEALTEKIQAEIECLKRNNNNSNMPNK